VSGSLRYRTLTFTSRLREVNALRLVGIDEDLSFYEGPAMPDSLPEGRVAVRMEPRVTASQVAVEEIAGIGWRRSEQPGCNVCMDSLV
jgi:hypothetical protein